MAPRPSAVTGWLYSLAWMHVWVSGYACMNVASVQSQGEPDTDGVEGRHAHGANERCDHTAYGMQCNAAQVVLLLEDDLDLCVTNMKHRNTLHSHQMHT